MYRSVDYFLSEEKDKLIQHRRLRLKDSSAKKRENESVREYVYRCLDGEPVLDIMLLEHIDCNDDRCYHKLSLLIEKEFDRRRGVLV